MNVPSPTIDIENQSLSSRLFITYLKKFKEGIILRLLPKGLLVLGLFSLLAFCRCSPTSLLLKNSEPLQTAFSSHQLPRNILWIDALENAPLLARPGGIPYIVQQCVKAHIDTVVLGVKDVSGLVIYPSKIAPHFSEWSLRTKGTNHYRYFPPHFDAVKAFLEESKKYNISVYAGVPVFMEGTRLSPRLKIGPVFEHPEWMQISYTGRFVPVSRYRQFIYVSPHHPEVRARELALLREIGERYPLKGIILDYCRYAGPSCDFSLYARRDFEKWLGRRVRRWPQEVLPGGPLYNQWNLWREESIRTFVKEVREVLKALRPDLLLGGYFGGWYQWPSPTGQNWASAKCLPPSPARQTAQADLYDFLFLGFYSPKLRPTDPGPSYLKSMEEGITSAQQVLCGIIPFRGGLYLRQFQGQPHHLQETMAYLRKKTSGVMLFDLSWAERLNLWPVIEKALWP